LRNLHCVQKKTTFVFLHNF